MPRVEIDGVNIAHSFDFDPSYGYDRTSLAAVEVPPEPPDFADFWRARHATALRVAPQPQLTDTGRRQGNWQIHDLSYRSTGGLTLGGWALVPENLPAVRRGFVVGHGYGGREGPDFNLPFGDAVILFPCARGISRSQWPDIPHEPNRHAVHEIGDRDRYVIGGCVDDLWLAVSALLELFPQVGGHVGVLGVSFSGGITILAAPWDTRIARVHVNVPTFGHQPLRLALPSVGSAQGVQVAARLHPERVAATLAYFDAAIAATHLSIPTLCACACFDPAVAPPGQWAIFNALPPANRELFVLTAGHHPYRGQSAQETALLAKINTFFAL